MSSKADLKHFLSNISKNTRFIKFDYRSHENFSIVLKCDVDNYQTNEYYNRQTKDWLEQFSMFTYTNWIVRFIFPGKTEYLYRKIYGCQGVEDNTKCQSDRNTESPECTAKIEFIVKIAKYVTLKSDPYLRRGLNLSIFIDFTHSHHVRSAMEYRMWKVLNERDQIFYRYFDMGCTAAVAKSFNQLMLAFKFGKNSSEYLSSAVNPNLVYIDNLIRKWRNRKSSNNLTKIISDMKSKLTDAGGYLTFVESFTTAIIITPLMKRIIERHPLDSVHIDRTCVRYGLVVNILYVLNSVCLLPIVFIIQKQLDEHAFGLSIDSIKMYILKECNKQFEPKILTVNASEDHFQNMTAVFFNCKMFKSYTAMCKDVWHSLCYDENRISYRKRNDIMAGLQVLLSARNAETAHRIYTELIKNDVFQTVPSMKTLIDDVWERKDQWLEPDVCHQHYTLIDVCLRMTGQLFLSRCKAFNIYLMVDFVATIIESQWRTILHALITNNNLIPVHTRYLPRSNAILQMGPEITQIGDEFRYAVNVSKSIHFNRHTWRCNCVWGRKNEFCEHLTAILILRADVGKINIGERDRKLFIELLGETAEDLIIEEMQTDEGIYAPDLGANIKSECIETIDEVEENLDERAVSSVGAEIDHDWARNSPTLQWTDFDIHSEHRENAPDEPSRSHEDESIAVDEPITFVKTEPIDDALYNESKENSIRVESVEDETIDGGPYSKSQFIDDVICDKANENSSTPAKIPVIVTTKEDNRDKNYCSSKVSDTVIGDDKRENIPVRVSVIADGRSKKSTCRKLSDDRLYDRERDKNPNCAKSVLNVPATDDERTSPGPEQADDGIYVMTRSERKDDGNQPLDRNVIKRSQQSSAKRMRYTDISQKNTAPGSKMKYYNALKALNHQFRRLHGFFKENPNMSNVATIMRLTKELAKITPVERVDLSNMYLKLNA